MFLTKVKIGMALLLSLGVIMTGAGALTGAAWSERETPRANEVLPAAQAAPGQGVEAVPADKDARGARTVRGLVLDPDGKPFAGAKLYLQHPLDPRETDATAGEAGYAVRATSGDDGRFEFTFAKSELNKTKLVNPTPWWLMAGPDNPHGSQVMAVAKGYGCDWAWAGEHEVTLRLVKDVLISGRVLGPDRKPVAGAQVRVAWVGAYDADALAMMPRKQSTSLNLEKTWGGPLPGQATVMTTGADGRFHLSGFGGERQVRFYIEGPAIQNTWIGLMTRTDQVVARSQSPGDGARAGIAYGAEFDYVAAPSRPIRGVVRDKDSGKPVAGVSVHAYPQTIHRVVTDKEGTFELLGYPRSSTYTLYAIPPDGSHFAIKVQVPDAPELSTDIALPSGIIVRGRALDKASGQPAPGVRVYYYVAFPNRQVGYLDEYLPYGNALSTALTAPDGSFAMAVLPGPGVLAAAAKPLSSYRSAMIDPKELEDFFKKKPNPSNGDMIAVVQTGFGLGRQAQTHIVQSWYHALALINPDEKDQSLVRDLVLLPSLTRKATVVGPDGKPLSGVTAILDTGGGAITLESATFTVPYLHPARTRQFYFYHKEKNLGRFLELRGDWAEPLKVELQPCGSAEGRIIDHSGNPAAGMVLCFCRAGTPVFWPGGVVVKTDQAGRYSAKGLVPGQKYQLNRPPATNQPANLVREVPDSLPEVTVRAGEKKELGDGVVVP